MANESLTAEPLSHNDITCLAAVLERNFQYNRKKNHIILPPQKYIDTLKMAVGLGFTAIIVDNSCISRYQSVFNRFLDNSSLLSTLDSITTFSVEAATILDRAAPIVNRYGFNRNCYFAFVNTLTKVLKSGLEERSQKINDDSCRLMEKMIKTRLW